MAPTQAAAPVRRDAHGRYSGIDPLFAAVMIPTAVERLYWRDGRDTGGDEMGKVVAGASNGPANPMGDGGWRRFDW